MLNKSILGVKKVQGQSETALQTGTVCVTKTLISVEAKKLHIKNLFNYLNDIATIVYSIFSQLQLALSLGHLFQTIMIINKGGQVTKPIIVMKICYKLLYVCHSSS